MSYEDIYNNYYVKLPKIVSISWKAFWLLVGLLDVAIATEGFMDEYEGILRFLVGSNAYTSAILAALVWLLISLLFGYIIHFVLKTTISQKIVVVDRLTKIMENTQKN